MKDLPEAPVTMFTNYKRTDGFEVSVTLRGNELAEVASQLDAAIKNIIKSGGTPVSRQNVTRFPTKAVEYVEGAVCPKDGGRLIKATTKAGKTFQKCENQKYDFMTKTVSGCDYTKWPEMTNNDL